jgi:hypothetical protein
MPTLAGDDTANKVSPQSNTFVPVPAGDPFRVFGIVGFVLSLFAILNFAGLVISIIALLRSKRAGYRNRFARGRCGRRRRRAGHPDHRGYRGQHTR